MGGGMGLAAACDICIASTTASFATSEVTLGIIPAVISPYVVRAIGERKRAEERRLGNECVRTCRSRWSMTHYKKTHRKLQSEYIITIHNDNLKQNTHKPLQSN